MKKGLITIGIIVIVGLILYSFFAGRYNKMVELQEAIPKEWAQVETQYQRRADLIPNLVNTVKGYAKFEQETLTRVIEARASATQVKVDPTNITPEALQKFQQAQNGVSSALGRLLAVVENYPDLKANQNFLDLQAQLEGTENRIAVARRDYIEAVRVYNTTLRTFPSILWAKFWFTDNEPFQNFTVTEEQMQPPQVDFN